MVPLCKQLKLVEALTSKFQVWGKMFELPIKANPRFEVTFSGYFVLVAIKTKFIIKQINDSAATMLFKHDIGYFSQYHIIY